MVRTPSVRVQRNRLITMVGAIYLRMNLQIDVRERVLRNGTRVPNTDYNTSSFYRSRVFTH